MKVKKLKYSKNGKTSLTSKFYAEWVDWRGTLRRVALVTDERAAKEMGARIDRLNSLAAAGGTITPDLSVWIERSPTALITKLSGWGMIPRAFVASGKTLSEHLADWKASIIADGRTAKHAELVHSRASRLLVDACRFAWWSDVEPDPVAKQLAAWRKAGPLTKLNKPQPGISAQTYNFYLQSAQQFGRWMKSPAQRTEAEPLAHLKMLNVSTDRRHDRRAITVEEYVYLVHAAETGPEREGISGADRAIVYECAVTTGFRANETRQLLIRDFHLEGDKPSVTIPAKFAKNRKEETLPVPAATAAKLRRYFEDRNPLARAFKLPRPQRLSKMLAGDLEAGRASWIAAATTVEDRDGRMKSDFLNRVDAHGRHIDFHALRHTRGVWLFVHNKASPREVQAMMRVSSLALVDRYTKSFSADGAAIAERGPDLTGRPAAKSSAGEAGDKGSDKKSSPSDIQSDKTEDESSGVIGLQNRDSRVRIPLRPVLDSAVSPENTEVFGNSRPQSNTVLTSLAHRQNAPTGDKQGDKPATSDSDPAITSLLEQQHGERCALVAVDDLIAGAARLRTVPSLASPRPTAAGREAGQ